MQVYLYVEINIFAIIILLLIYMNIRRRSYKYLTEQALYMTLIILNISILIFDTFTWVLDGINTPFYKTILTLTTILYYLLHPVICMFWALYVDFQINRNKNRIKKMLYLMHFPVLFSTVLTLLSNFGNYYFYIDNYSVYHRGQYFMILPVISFAFISYATVYVLLNRRRIHKPYYLSLLMFAIPPFIGALIQIAFYGVALIWVGMTLSILIIFINIQNEQMYLDYLTGLFNRRQLDFFLQELIQKNKASFAGIMLDLNSFKNINDHYGHNTGDEALKYTSQLLKKTFPSHSFISRYGGDEFVVLIEIKDKIDLEKSLTRLRENIEQFNNKKAIPYEINLSIGADLYNYTTKMSGQEFLSHIDSLMYQDKQTLTA
ncbi:MAG: GGDEF domain-containing protein [Mobilitalea sp.]